MKLIPILLAALSSFNLLHAADTKAPEGIPSSYPLKKCVISNESFGGEMGKPVKATHGGTAVYLCCKSCLKDFHKAPARHVQMVKDAAAIK